MKRSILALTACLLVAMFLFSACSGATTDDSQAFTPSQKDVPSYAEGVLGSIQAGSILDWVWQTIPGKTLPSTGTYATVSSAFSGTFTANNTTFQKIPATDKTYLSLSGMPHPNSNSGQYYRLDYANKANYPGTASSGVQYLASQTAGGAIRFCTNATSIAIQATYQNCSTSFNHMAPKGIYGFDIYVGTGSNRTWVTNTQTQLVLAASSVSNGTVMSSSVSLPSGYKEVLICFPQYGGVTALNIGLPANSKIAAAPERSVKDILFYGTSITQGACANRAGTSYTNILGRMLDADVRNLGFSGSGCGEAIMAEYIAGLVRAGEVSAVVLDFERNNPSNASLAGNHYNFYRIIREADADIPIIMVTRPIYTSTPTETDLARHSIVANTYQIGTMNGDTNLYMYNGYEYFTPGMADLYTVDGTHPNDLGHYFMANKLYSYLYNCLYGNPANNPVPKLQEYSGAESYYAPWGYVEGAKTISTKWNNGFIPSTDQRSDANYDDNTNAYSLLHADGTVHSAYSYTDVISIPKAGTKIWFSLPGTTHTADSVAIVSYAVKEGDIWKFDASKTSIRGQTWDAYVADRDFGRGTVLYDSDGSVYFYKTSFKNYNTQYFCYITREDNENIRFTVQTNSQAQMPSAIYYVEQSGSPIHFMNEENYTKTKAEVTWAGNHYLQKDYGYLTTTLPFAASSLLTIPKAGTTVIWFDDIMPDPESKVSGGTAGFYFESNRAYCGGTVSIASFTTEGVFTGADNDGFRIAANNLLFGVQLGGKNGYVDSLDGTVRVYYYTTTKDNETVRLSYYAGYDTDDSNGGKAFFVRPTDVYLYTPNN